MNKEQKINHAYFLSQAITQLKKEKWWTQELKTEYEIENNMHGFAPINALQEIYKFLILPKN